MDNNELQNEAEANMDPRQQRDVFQSGEQSTTRLDPTRVTAALMTPDSDVEMPSRSHAGSVVSNLCALAAGESFTKSIELPADLTLLDLQLVANDEKQRLRQSVNQSVRHATKHLNGRFTTESAMIVFPSGRAFVQVVVTRTG